MPHTTQVNFAFFFLVAMSIKVTESYEKSRSIRDYPKPEGRTSKASSILFLAEENTGHTSTSKNAHDYPATDEINFFRVHSSVLPLAVAVLADIAALATALLFNASGQVEIFANSGTRFHAVYRGGLFMNVKL